MSEALGWWWLSFANDSGCLGVAIVGESNDIVGATILAHALGINPGGEVLGFPVPPEIRARIPASDLSRLLTADEARALDARLAKP